MKKQNTLWIAVLVILVLTFGIGGVAAKYVRSRENIGVAKALEFYLTSNMLPGDHSLAPGTQSVSFTVGNYADDLRFAEMDIEVTVKVNGKPHGEAFTLAKDQKSERTVTITGLENGKTYSVEVTGDGGYVQSLTGTFTVLSPETGPFYFVEEKMGYTEVTIWCRGIAAPTDVILHYPEGTIPDNTNPHMATWLTGEQTQTINMNPYESYRYQFFNAGAITVTGAAWKQPE